MTPAQIEAAIASGMRGDPVTQIVCLSRGVCPDFTRPYEHRVWQAVGCAKTLITKAGKPGGVAVTLAARKYDVDTSDVASRLGQRGGVARRGRR